MKLIALLSVAIVSLATAQKLQVDKATSLNETQEQQQQMPVISGDGSGSLLDSTSGSQDLSASTSASGSWGDFFVGDSDSASASDESASSEETSEASVESSSGSESSATTSLSASGDVSGFESSSSGESDLGSLPDTTSESQAASAATSASGSYGGSDADSDAASESSEESDSSSDASASSTTTSLSASASGDASGSVSSGSNKMGLDSLLDSASGSQEEGASKGASGSTDDVFDSDSEAESASSASDDSGSSSETSAASLPASSSGDASGFAASGSGEIDQSKSETQEGSTATSASESSSETESNAALQESAASEDNGSSTTPLSASASGSASSFSDQSSPVYSTSGSQDASDSTSASGSSTDVNVGDSDSASTSEESGSSGSPPTPAPTEAPTPAPAPTTPPISVDDSVQLSESFGGPHGNEFSDERAATSGQTVASITIRAGERVDGVILDITAPVAITLNHGGGGGNPNTLTLGPGEYITSMEAHWGEKKGHTRIFYLRFGTSAGNSVEGGSMTDSKATVTAPDGFQLGGFFGRDGDEIDLLGAIWTSIVPITPAPGAPTPAPTPWVEKIIDHDAVVPFKQPEPVTIFEKAAIKFKPQLHITNGCHAYPAVNVGGQTSGGLKTKGAPSAGCKGSGWGSQVYGRSSWYNGVWAIMYSWYFPKDSPSTGLGHRHDWEHVIVWIDNPEIAEPKILAVTPSAHSGYSAQVPPDANKVEGTSVKVKYLSKWPINHALESTGEGGDYQDLIMWGQMTDAAREGLSRTSFGDANVPMNDGNFESKLGRAWPFK
ncbi:hypothetical protein PC110_g9305 [Phytophthora cactorum]|uniref:Jacalin-type lectin domain-containing protein n=2 Tax=Phytophthora cactorum TaxID=29920 RepID=A0A329SFH6_9STRA|nr:hypothetical protein PC110_g9305 [Phytophthora cactorum]